MTTAPQRPGAAVTRGAAFAASFRLAAPGPRTVQGPDVNLTAGAPREDLVSAPALPPPPPRGSAAGRGASARPRGSGSAAAGLGARGVGGPGPGSPARRGRRRRGRQRRHRRATALHRPTKCALPGLLPNKASGSSQGNPSRHVPSPGAAGSGRRPSGLLKGKEDHSGFLLSSAFLHAPPLAEGRRVGGVHSTSQVLTPSGGGLPRGSTLR